MRSRVYPTLAETIEAHRLLIEEFGGLHGIQDLRLLESAVFRPQSGYYTDLIEEASALMESLAINHAFHDGHKRISFAMADAMLRANGYFLEVDAEETHRFIGEAMGRNEFHLPVIQQWIRQHIKPLEQ